MSTDVAAVIDSSPALTVRPDFRTGLPLNIALFTVGAFWLLLGTVAALHAHLAWTLICCLLGFAFFASPLLYYRNASVWVDDTWAGRTDLLGRRVAAARRDLASVEDVKWITRRYVFLRKDGRRAFDIHAYGWKQADIAALVDALGL